MGGIEKNNPLASISDDPELCAHTRATVRTVLELGDPEMLVQASPSFLYHLLQATATELDIRFAGHELADKAPAVKELLAQQAELVMVGVEATS